MTDEEIKQDIEITAAGEEKDILPPKTKKEGKTDLIFYIICALILACSIGFRIYWTDTFCAVTVSGDSMNQTLKSGDK